MSRTRRHAGFTLIELLLVMTIIGILAAIAIPAWGSYTQRARLAAGVAVLKETKLRLEQFYAGNRSYASGGACAVADFYDREGQFNVSCTTAASGQQFTLTATGINSSAGFVYSINDAGVEATAALPAGWFSGTLPVNRFIVRKE